MSSVSYQRQASQRRISDSREHRQMRPRHLRDQILLDHNRLQKFQFHGIRACRQSDGLLCTPGSFLNLQFSRRIRIQNLSKLLGLKTPKSKSLSYCLSILRRAFFAGCFNVHKKMAVSTIAASSSPQTVALIDSLVPK